MGTASKLEVVVLSELLHLIPRDLYLMGVVLIYCSDACLGVSLLGQSLHFLALLLVPQR